MATLRLIKPEEPTPASASSKAPEDASPGSASDSDAGRRSDARIRLDSLPTALRATIRERKDNLVTIEAELPWLAVGTVVHASGPDGTEQSGHVQSFDVEVTSAGSARLLIFADLALPGLPKVKAAAASHRPVRAKWGPILTTAALLASFAGGYLAREHRGHSPAPTVVVEAAPPPPSPAAVAPPEPIAPPPPVTPPSPAAALEAPPPAATTSASSPMRKVHRGKARGSSTRR
jgi:hypothetical protein